MNTSTTKKTFKLNGKAIAANLAVLAVTMGGTVWAMNIAFDSVEPETITVPATEIPKCATEDSSNCLWDATVQGNNQGTSFVDVDGATYLPEHALNGPTACAEQLKAYARDSTSLSYELASQWASSQMGETTYGEWVITDNIQPMQDRYDYILRTFCADLGD